MIASIITVNFGDTAPTNGLVKSLEKCADLNKINLIIVDNLSSEKSYKELKLIKEKTKIKVDIIPFKNNYFYWRAAKKALDIKKNIYKDKDGWIIVCNNDILFDDKNFFKKLFKLDNNIYHVVGAKITDYKKRNLNPFMTKPLNSLKLIYWNIYFQSYYISIFLNFLKTFKLNLNKSNINNFSQVYAIHGSAMIFSNFFFHQGGWLDDNFDLYCEELSTAEIAKKIGCKIFYRPELKLFHNSHYNTSKISKYKLYKLSKASHKYFISRYLKN